MGFFEPPIMTPFSFQFPLADFDLTRLPVDPALLRDNASMLASAVQEFYRDSFQNLGGSATVLVRDGVVSVAWQPESGDASAQLLQHAIDLLRQGNASSAEPILRALLAQDARNSDALYNLGMMLSDQGRLAEAVETLQESLNFHPAHSEGWTALGVAQARLNGIPEALKALERAIEIDPSNAHALRNLAAIHAKESPSRALPFMQEAALLLPADQRSQYGLAQCLLQLDRVDEAGRGGFDINNPDKKYTLKSLPGDFSGLHLVSIMYVGMQALAPTTDVGIDLSKEYAEAKRLFALEK